MVEDRDNIMLEILKKLQAGQSRLEAGQRQTNERLASIEHHVAGFHLLTKSARTKIILTPQQGEHRAVSANRQSKKVSR